MALVWFVLASVFYTYPLAIAPATANRLDSPDALLNAWIVSWNLHQLQESPTELFDANIFYPETGALAYSENLLTASVLAAPVAAFTDSPIVRVNVALFAAFVLTGLATFALAYDLTGDRLASLLAGTLFAYAPFRFAHIPHLQLQLAFGIPLCLLFIRRLVRPGSRRLSYALGFAAAALATFGSSIYYLVFVMSVVPVVALTEIYHLEAVERPKAIYWLTASGLLAAGLTFPFAWPYLEKLSSGTVRSLTAADQYSATALDYVSSFSRLHAFLPSTDEPLFPGGIAIGLAVFALAAGAARASRKWSWALVGAIGLVISLGPPAGVFTLLYRFVPVYRAIRVPSRAGVLVLLAVALLAAIGLAAIRRRRLRVLCVVIACGECLAAPLPWRFELPSYPPIYEAVEALEEPGALLELPMPPRERFQDNALYVYRSAFHWRALVNGYSGFAPASYTRREQGLRRDLSAELSLARVEGVRFVLAHEGRLGPRMRRRLAEAQRSGQLDLVAQASTDRLYTIQR